MEGHMQIYHEIGTIVNAMGGSPSFPSRSSLPPHDWPSQLKALWLAAEGEDFKAFALPVLE
jgi:hypothetical protein